MNEWAAGYAIGMAAGLAIGFMAGRKQKPWSELNEKEKRLRIGLIIGGAALVIAGAVAFLLVY